MAAGLAAPSSADALMLFPCMQPVQELLQFPETRTITVQPGETLWDIANREYGTPWAYGALASTNGISNPQRIKAGDNLQIYTGRTTTTLQRTYTIEDLCPITDSDSPAPKTIYHWK